MNSINTASYRHELLDRVYVLASTFETHIAQHPALNFNEVLKADIDEMSEKLWDLYQKIGAEL